MKKKKLIYGVLVVIVLSILYYFYSLQGWKKVPTRSIRDWNFVIEYNQFDGTIWGAEIIGTGTLFYYDPPNVFDLNELTNPYYLEKQGVFVNDICSASNKMWIVGTDIHSYDLETRSWNEYLELEIPPDTIHRCLSRTNGDVVFIQTHGSWLATFDEDVWVVENTPINNLMDIGEDNEGNLWALTGNSELYRYDEELDEWLLFENLEEQSVQLLSISMDNYLWVGGSRYLYRWSLDSSSGPEKFSIGDEFALSLESDHFSSTWIATNKGLWLFKDGKLTNVELPLIGRPVFSIAIDNADNKIYISTGEGLFYRDLED